MDVADFLNSVLTSDTPNKQAKGWLLISYLPAEGDAQVWDEWFQWPRQQEAVLALIAAKKPTCNLYFSPHLFQTKGDPSATNTVTTRTIAADIDTADIDHLPMVPSLIVSTSPERHQAYWLVKETLSQDVLERVSRNLTYTIPKSDRTGWMLGRRMRLPDTLNHKYPGIPTNVLVTDTSSYQYDISTLELLPVANEQQVTHFDVNFIDTPPTSFPDGPNELIERLRKEGRVSQALATNYGHASRDKIKTMWTLMTSLFRAGLEREAVYWLALKSRNNYFAAMRRGGERELAKEILRAEAFIKTRGTEPRELVMEARKVSGFHAERKAHLMSVILSLMRQDGTFIRTGDDHAWYVRRDAGRPILLEHRNTLLNSLLNIHYGLNAVENDFNYVEQGLVDHGKTLPINGNLGSLSFHDQMSNPPTAYLHTGKREVIQIRATSIERIIDGANGVVFPWPPTVEPFSPITNQSVTSEVNPSWGDLLFKDGLQNVVNLDPEEAMAIMQVWFMFLLVRSVSLSRPILAFFGAPGSGKSTMFRRVYSFLYGKTRSLSSVTSPDDYDHAVSTDPLVVLDNVDTWERWLPDRLALSASTSDRTVRRLYTNSEVVVLKRQALVAITAHNPQFGRPDVADRLLIINLERFPKFMAEGPIIGKIERNRNVMWGSVVRDLQRLLDTRMPDESTIPQFRIEDFARNGCWISDGLGIRRAFESAIKRIKSSQRHFSLEDENLLVEALESVVKRSKGDTGWLSPGSLWASITLHAKDTIAISRVYRNAPTLSKRLIGMQEPLKESFIVDWKMDSTKGTRMWRFRHGTQAA